LLAESSPFDRADPVVSPDGGLTAIPRGSKIEIYDVATGELVMGVGDYPDARSLRVESITTKHLLVSGVDGNDKPFSELWDLLSGELIRKVKPLDFPNYYSDETYCVHDQLERCIVCGSDPLQIFDIRTGELIYSNKAQDGTIVWAISPDGNTLATCTVVYKPVTDELIPGNRIFILDIPKSTSIIAGVLEAPNGEICSPIIFSPDSQYLATQSGYIWRLGQQQPQTSFTGNNEDPLAFSPDGRLLISGNQVIDTLTGKILNTLKVNGEVKMVGFDPDGTSLIFRTDQGVEVWKMIGD
jgi:WD40 repeat protein